jgi:hypothetical protein
MPWYYGANLPPSTTKIQAMDLSPVSREFEVFQHLIFIPDNS